MPRAYGETSRHAQLKQLALAWAHDEGLILAAPEVAFPHRRFRFDVAACRPSRLAPSRTPARSIDNVLRTAAVFECKQVRSDLIRDNARRDRTGRALRELQAQRLEMEARLSLHLPHLTMGESLFPEFDSYRLRECGHAGHRKLVNKIGAVQQALLHGTKFDRLAAYRLANVHYLVTEPGLIRPHELPPGWGLLERDGQALRLREKPVWTDIAVEMQVIFLQRIASRNAWRRALAEDGLGRTTDDPPTNKRRAMSAPGR